MGRWANKYVIGLTGNIAMGKSLVRKMLENLGAYTIDADGLAHQAMAPGAPAYAPVVETFGKWILMPDGKIDRSKLGAVAFAHNEALNTLETITHPVVGQAIDILISRARQPIVVVEAIKLVDGVLGDQVDAVWVVEATPEQQLSRLMSKRGLTDYEAHKRIDTQNPQADKLARATVIIHNSGSPEETWAQVQHEWDRALGRTDSARRTEVVPQQPKPAPLPDTPTRVIDRGTVLANSAPAPAAAAPVAPDTSSAAPAPAAAPHFQPASVTVTPPAAPVTSAPAPVAPPATAPVNVPAADGPIEVRRGLPKHADVIARLLSQAAGEPVSRNDVMMAFGEKSFLMADIGGRTVGLAGFQVENLIARLDEFVIVPDVSPVAVTRALIEAVETAARELQTEVGFVFMSRTAPANRVQAFLDEGYERIVIDALRIPAWREAVAEVNTDKQILMKKLRDSLVLTPN